MDAEIAGRISREWGVPSETIQHFSFFYENSIRPIIKSNFLSHLVTTVENMVNDKRSRIYLERLRKSNLSNTGRNELRGFLATKTFRLYSIILEPVNLNRRATTRYHPSGAIIYYNSRYEEKAIRILIAHEIGHIVIRELMEDADTEQKANLFAFIALLDKNKFYADECDKFVFSDIQIFNDIMSICPTCRP